MDRDEIELRKWCIEHVRPDQPIEDRIAAAGKLLAFISQASSAAEWRKLEGDSRSV